MLSIELLRYDREPHDKPELPAEQASVVRRESTYFASQSAVRASSRTRRQVGWTRRVQRLLPQIERRMTGKEVASA